MRDDWKQISFERFAENRKLETELDTVIAGGETWMWAAFLLTAAGFICLLIDRL